MVSGRTRGLESRSQTWEHGIRLCCLGGRGRICYRVAPYRWSLWPVRPRARRSLGERFYNSVSRRRLNAHHPDLGIGSVIILSLPPRGKPRASMRSRRLMPSCQTRSRAYSKVVMPPDTRTSLHRLCPTLSAAGTPSRPGAVLPLVRCALPVTELPGLGGGRVASLVELAAPARRSTLPAHACEPGIGGRVDTKRRCS